MMKRILFLLFFLTASLANAQDMFQEYLYSADIVMKNRDKISLTDSQADKIKKIHSTNAADFSTLKWDLDAETEKLKKLLAQTKPDPAAVTKQMDLVLNLENQLKKKQLSTLVAIKNELTENQINDLSKTKVLGRVTSWEYTPGGASPTLGATGTTYRIGKDLYGTNPEGKGSAATKVNGTRVAGVSGSGTNSSTTSSVNGSARSSVYIQTSPDSPNSTPIYYLKTKNGSFEQLFDVQSIDPKNIESLEVLKGETATIRFGDKGKNGVLIFTLKDKKDESPTEF
jgi:Spy/CpxP family protein refolding chaperone